MFVQILRSWHLGVTTLECADVSISSEARVKVRMSVVVDEGARAEVTLVLRLGEEI